MPGNQLAAGMNSAPRLVEGGQNVLNEGSLDEKQRTTRSTRGALGLRGQTLYAVIAQGATISDLAEILVSLGVDSAMNIDGGGSSAMVYRGAYKVGPGRQIPNALVIIH
ncbi:phosphodiester glycosidase family protein [Candidatus Berkelbacteria bacterium]|nr:phosphodiester glycosidase family protein [Candidatus Berkelbacteria bacterium]